MAALSSTDTVASSIITKSKKIFLLRHAKSSWKIQKLPDFQRPLDPIKSVSEVQLVSAYLLAKYKLPKLVLCSSAERCKATWKLINNAFKQNDQKEEKEAEHQKEKLKEKKDSDHQKISKENEDKAKPIKSTEHQKEKQKEKSEYHQKDKKDSDHQKVKEADTVDTLTDLQKDYIEISNGSKIIYASSLYESSAQTLLDQIHKVTELIEEDIDAILIVAHNPGLENLLRNLTDIKKNQITLH